MFETESVIEFLEEFTWQLIEQAADPAMYAQLGLVLLSIIIGFSLSLLLRRYTPILKTEPEGGHLLGIRRAIYASRGLLSPIFTILTLSVSIELAHNFIGYSWLVRLANSLAVILLIYNIISNYIHQNLVKSLVKWIVIPIAVLQVFGWLEPVTTYLDTIDINIGNIRVSAYGVIRVIIFGTILFWLGRLSNRAGQRIIRQQTDMHIGTREVLAKLFEVAVFLVIFLLLLQVMGINLTALAVFGGALGVGIGLGLQSIASNFISGIIILLDRSVSIGDYVELEGVTGVVREMNMRCTIVETFDGKDIVIPNEKFINSNVINWTHKDDKQRYSLNFQVAYSTDLDKLFEVVREVCKSHPKVLSGPNYSYEEQPDAEIQSFDDFGITILVEFWMRGIDDGKNRVGADLLHMIWNAMCENGFEIPFPQREVRILNEVLPFSGKPST